MPHLGILGADPDGASDRDPGHAEWSALPVVDSADLIARHAVEVALGDRPLPTWGGGIDIARS